MSATINHESIGAELASECLDSILNAPDQASAGWYLLGLLNNLSGCGEIEKGARFACAREIGFDAIRADGVQ
jgi:hypothetical protein